MPEPNRKGSHRLVEAFYYLFTESIVFERHPSRHGLEGRTLNTHATGIGQLLESLRHDHAGPGNGAVGNDDFSKPQSDPHPGFYIVARISVATRVIRLKGERCGYRIGSFPELGDERIAPDLVRDAAVGIDDGNKPLECRLNTLMRAYLVLLHQPGRVNHVSVQDNGELSA